MHVKCHESREGCPKNRNSVNGLQAGFFPLEGLLCDRICEFARSSVVSHPPVEWACV